MKKGRFENIGTIFAFTFRQSATGKAFVFMTLVLPILLFALGFAVNVIPAAMGEDVEVSEAERVYLVDDSGTEMVGEVFLQLLDRERFANLTVNMIYGRDVEEVCKEISPEDTNSFVIHVEQNVDEGVPVFKVTAIVPEWCTLPEEDYEELLSLTGTCMESVKVATAGIDYESLVYLSSAVYSDIIEAGEAPESFASVMIKSLAPMLATLVLYMMIILYGQSIGKVVVAEKNSKLMEMLLTSVQPDALIAGKILAMTCLALMQLMLWIIGFVAGFAAGNMIGGVINPDFDNVVLNALSLVMEQSAGAFSPMAIVLSLLSLIFGFGLFCVLAGLVASCIGKAEELANGMGIYNVLVIIGFFGSYFTIMMENEAVSRIIRIIPLTSAFILSSDILVGNAGLLEGFLELLILIASNVALIIVTARVYKAKVFYVGTNVVTSKLGFLGKKHQEIQK